MSTLQKLREKRRQQQELAPAAPEPARKPEPAPKREPIIPEGWTDTGRTKGDRPIYQVYATFEKRESAVRKILRQHWERLDLDNTEVRVGETCKKCNGMGYIPQFAKHGEGRCYWCNDPRTTGPGKGVINGQDKAYIDARIKAGTACGVVAA